jgi:hypothetical protein
VTEETPNPFEAEFVEDWRRQQQRNHWTFVTSCHIITTSQFHPPSSSHYSRHQFVPYRQKL